MNILEVDGAVARSGTGWVRTENPWAYNGALATTLSELRRIESQQMLHWAKFDGCRLRFLRDALDDASAVDCGRCDNCSKQLHWQRTPDSTLVAHANDFLRGGELIIEPRKQWPTGLAVPKGRIPVDRQAEPGRALARFGDGGWSTPLAALIDAADRGDEVVVPDQLINALVAVLKEWPWEQRPTWICPMPSRRRSTLIQAVANRLGTLGKLPVHQALRPASTEVSTPQPATYQAEQANSAHQVANLWGRIVADPAAFPVDPSIASGPVLLIDDEADTRWTLTVAAFELTGIGAHQVLPLTLRTR